MRLFCGKQLDKRAAQRRVALTGQQFLYAGCHRGVLSDVSDQGILITVGALCSFQNAVCGVVHVVFGEHAVADEGHGDCIARADARKRSGDGIGVCIVLEIRCACLAVYGRSQRRRCGEGDKAERIVSFT